MSRSADFRFWATKTDERAGPESATLAERSPGRAFGPAGNFHHGARGCAADKPCAAHFDSGLDPTAR